MSGHTFIYFDALEESEVVAQKGSVKKVFHKFAAGKYLRWGLYCKKPAG